jgi:hypothetical protein
MYNILLLALSYSLPPLNNVYSGSISFPLLGKQIIEFERLKKNTSQVRLIGLINCNGFVYNDENYDNYENNENNENNENVSNKCLRMNYELDEYLLNIIRKYRCSIEAPYYDVRSDTILFVLKINMLGVTKSIKLLNIKN